MQEMLTAMLKEQVTGQLNKQIASSLGVSDDAAQGMIENSLPYLLGAIDKNTNTAEGAESLLTALSSGKHDEVDAEALAANPESGEGAGILKHVFGDDEEAVEAEVAKKAGVDTAQAKKTMMVVAPMLMAALGKVVKSDNLSADKLSAVVTDLTKTKDFSSAGMSVVTSLIDKDKDGDIKDDLIGIAKNWLSNKLTKK